MDMKGRGLGLLRPCPSKAVCCVRSLDGGCADLSPRGRVADFGAHEQRRRRNGECAGLRAGGLGTGLVDQA
jgi:hypothetical protein